MNKNTIVTTSWDDGHVLDKRLTALMQKYAIPGTIYYAPHNRERDVKDLLSVEDIQELSDSFEIGAHTMTHPDLKKLSLKEARREIVDSKSFLEDALDQEVRSFCYPKGRYNTAIKNIVQESGFENARTVARFQFAIRDTFEAGTSVNTYRHFQDIHKIVQFSHYDLSIALKNWDWSTLAMRMFDYVLENGGIFHLWGHSWEVDMHNDWERLEKVFEYIGKRKNTRYAAFSDAVQLYRGDLKA